MRVIRTNESVPQELRGGSFAIGNFDGVHLGHAALLAKAREVRVAGAPFGAITFTPHPSKVLNAALAPRLMLNAGEKESALAAHGLDVLALVTFDAAFARLTPNEFIDRVLVEWLGARAIVVGEQFRFGHKASGTIADLRAAIATGKLARVEEVASVRVGGLIVSSTKMRELVLEGRVDGAAQLLGRAFFVEGEVVRGDGRGRTIGVPTANVAVERELMPKLGVYASRVLLADGRSVNGVTNIGLRPTFQGEGVRVEAHLFDFSEDLYGQRVKVELVKHLRGEQKFGGVDALKEQIGKDIAAAKAALA